MWALNKMLTFFFYIGRAWTNNSHVETVKYLINKK